MQINTPQSLIPPTPAAVAPQAVRNFIQPPAAPTITPRAIDSGEQGNKGSSTGTATQKQSPIVRSTAGRSEGRGTKLDLFV